MIETTYMISAVSCIITGSGCLTIGWLIGQHQSNGDRERLAHYDQIARIQQSNKANNEDYLQRCQTQFDADAIRRGDMCVHDHDGDFDDEEFEPDFAATIPLRIVRPEGEQNG